MSKVALLVMVTAVLAYAYPQQPDKVQARDGQPAVQVLRQDQQVNVDGYNFEFETSDGTARQEQGEYRNDTEQQGLQVKGSYKYVAPDGQHISVTYLADSNGYQPTEHRGDENPSRS